MESIHRYQGTGNIRPKLAGGEGEYPVPTCGTGLTAEIVARSEVTLLSGEGRFD